MCGKVRACRLMGTELDKDLNYTLWYRNQGSSLTITGKTEITGRAALPKNGVIYGQMPSVFFSGMELSPVDIDISGSEMPPPDIFAMASIEDIFSFHDIIDPVIREAAMDFHYDETFIVCVGNVDLTGCSFSGNIIVAGDKIKIDSTCNLQNIIIAANYIEIGDGVCGSFQAFGRDSVKVGSDVRLDLPSGVYSEGKLSIGPNTTVNGYLINNFQGEKNIQQANTVKDKTSIVRGLYYSGGISQLQGIVTGSAFVDEAVYYAPQGYYRNLIYDAAFVETERVPYPLWINRGGKRVEAGWIE
ncbi:MAG: hypothetical protein LIO77_07875 [Rikenellaceae bacterium]|nr:hypothetical protein [Rikenellaceae bacterium]